MTREVADIPNPNRVLMTQGTRPFAQRVAKLLPARWHTFFGSADEMPEVLLGTGNYLRIPKWSSPTYAHEMLKICLDLEVDTLFPLGTGELQLLAASMQLFGEYGIDLWAPDVADLEEMVIMENPPRALPLLVLRAGIPIDDTMAEQQYGSLSGVFTLSDDGQQLALCCMPD